jgi:hypothetical protein
MKRNHRRQLLSCVISDVNAATSLALGNGVGILAYGGNVNLTITDTAAGNKLAVVANSAAVMERLATMRSELAQNQRRIVSVNRIRSTKHRHSSRLPTTLNCSIPGRILSAVTHAVSS